MNDYTSLMISLWQSACQDTPKRPSACVKDGHFVLTINGNRDNWAAITQAAGVPQSATTTIDGDTVEFRSLPSGSILPVSVKRVFATGQTGTIASAIVALY